MAPTTTALTVFKPTLSIPSNNEKALRKANVDRIDTITSPGQDKASLHRDVRAYERERQGKYAGQWAKRRARKTVSRPGGARAAHRHDTGRQPKSLKGGKVGLEVDDGYAVTRQGRDTEHTTAKMCDGLGVTILTKVSLPPSEDGAFEADSRVKVNLSEIMKLSQRKARKLNVDDFEVIPRIRPVIALDDVDVHDIIDMDLDEPWEHIYHGERKASDGVSIFGRLTYARVAGTGCQ